MELKTLTREQLVEAVDALTEEQKDELRAVAEHLSIGFSGNTGFKTLKEKVDAFLADPLSDVPEAELPEQESAEAQMAALGLTVTPEKTAEVVQDAPEEETEEWTDAKLAVCHIPSLTDDILIRRAMKLQYMRLERIRITNLDPADSALQGAIITVNNAYLGKVSKFIPYDDTSENGYHVPVILANELRNRKFPMRKEQKRNRFGVKTYKTIMANKFQIDVLEPLSSEELEELGKRQAASQAIDN